MFKLKIVFKSGQLLKWISEIQLIFLTTTRLCFLVAGEGAERSGQCLIPECQWPISGRSTVRNPACNYYAQPRFLQNIIWTWEAKANSSYSHKLVTDKGVSLSCISVMALFHTQFSLEYQIQPLEARRRVETQSASREFSNIICLGIRGIVPLSPDNFQQIYL